MKVKNEGLKIYRIDNSTKISITKIDCGISAGFPSPAADFIDNKIDLNKYLIKSEASTFIAVTDGVSMINAGIGHGDLLIVDKALEPVNGKVAICVLDGEFVLKRLKIEKGEVWLMPENEKYKPIKVTNDNDFEVWGMVTYSIQKHY